MAKKEKEETEKKSKKAERKLPLVTITAKDLIDLLNDHILEYTEAGGVEVQTDTYSMNDLGKISDVISDMMSDIEDDDGDADDETCDSDEENEEEIEEDADE